MTDDELAEVKARAAEATPGPWTRESCGCCVYAPEGLTHFDDPVAGTGGIPSPDDAAFIAHAREDVPALLAEVWYQRAEVQKWRDIYARTAGPPNPWRPTIRGYPFD